MIRSATAGVAALASFSLSIMTLLLTALVQLVLVSPAVATEPPVTAVAISPDGKSIVVGSQAGLRVLSWPDLQVRQDSSSKLSNIHDLAFSPDARTIAVAGGAPGEQGMVEFVSWPSLETKRIWTATDDLFTSVRWLDANSLAIGGHDHSVSIWNLGSETPERTLLGHSRGVTSLALISGQQLLVSGGLDNSLRVWDIAAEQGSPTSSADALVRSLNIHTRPVLDLALRPSGEGLPMVASASEDRTVRLWQPTIGRMVRFARLAATPLSLAWFPDGSLLAAACSDGHVRIIDPEMVQVTHDVPAVEGWAYALAIHPSDQGIVVGGSDGVVKRFEIEVKPAVE